MKQLIIPVLLFVGFALNVSAQEKSSSELKGDRYTFSFAWDKAIDSYTRTKHLSMEGQRRLAESYHKIDQNIQSEAVYSRIVNATENVLPEDYFNYALVLKMNGNYDESNKWMDKFVTLKPDDLRAKDYIANKKGFANLLKDAGHYKIEHLNMNTDALDFGTSYYKNSLVFTSNRKPSKWAVKNYNWTRKSFWELYVSEVVGNQLKNPTIFDKKLNGALHDGPASFSNDGTFMAFTKNFDKSKDQVVELRIYFSNFKDGEWSKPESFFLNSEHYSVGHPCLTSDGKTMYFTSDMPGGYGKTDIYRISKDEKGAWGKPENLGAEINTEGDEMFPFLEENSKSLFFSSNGRFGLGGLDIFSCTLIGDGFGPVFNAGYPLNTQYDDFAAIANNTLSKGYFSSNRSGGSGGDDLYAFDILEVKKPVVILAKPAPSKLHSFDTLVVKKPVDLDVAFSVYAPQSIPIERRIRETFPLRNYVFFNQGSTKLIDRYEKLGKEQAKNFKEEQLERFTSKDSSGRSTRQMVIYYNVLNILGDRMRNNPTSTIKLNGSSMGGQAEGMKMAETVKAYLTGVFGIGASRISLVGSLKPAIPSEQPGGKRELVLLRQEDHRVSITSNSAALLMKFQGGSEASLKPVEIVSVEEAELETDVTFHVEGAKKALSSWSLQLSDETGKVLHFGSFTQDTVKIPAKSILGARLEGDFKATMIGQTKNGNRVQQEAPIHIVVWKAPRIVEMMRFSVIFEFNDSQALTIYKRFLTDEVTPKIPKGGTVVIHGHTDVIGFDANNKKLSMARANKVRYVIEDALAVAGRSDVIFEVYGYGEDPKFSQFENQFPEERFYNRTVIIDIMSGK